MGATHLRYSHNSLLWFPEGDSVRVATDFLNRELSGAGNFEILIDTHKENGIQDPEVLQRMENLRGVIQEISEQSDKRIGKTVSILEIIKETNQALNENRAEFYSIPDDPELIAQELLLFENGGSDDIGDFVDSQFSQARMSVSAKRVDAFDNITFMEEILARFQQTIGETGTVRITGLQPLMVATMKAVIFSLSRSYGLAFMMITPLMMLLIGSIRGGLISMVPNIAPILMTLGLMGWLDIPMDVFTLLIGCIAIGLAVDDTIHFIHCFQQNYGECGNPILSVQRTMETTGKALLFTSLVLATGFFIFMNSSMSNLFNFGLLTGFAISMAFLCDVLLTPALLVLASTAKSAGLAPTDTDS